jgi:polyisoprenoid-binding protein YceI
MYRIVPDRSRVYIDAQSSLHPIHATTTGLEGFIELAFGEDGEVDLTAKAAGRVSLAVGRLSSGNRLEDREMQRRIDARRYPTIEGALAGIAQGPAPDIYKVTGEVTFRGVSRAHEDLMTIRALDANTVRLEGRSRFDIRDYGMEPPRVLMLQVQPEVDVRVEILATKEEG